MRSSDWSSDVCSSDLRPLQFGDADWTENSLGIFRYVLAGRLPKQEGAQRVTFDDRRPEGDDILFGPDIGSLKCGQYQASGFYAFGELQQKAGLLADCNRVKTSQFRDLKSRLWPALSVRLRYIGQSD